MTALQLWMLAGVMVFGGIALFVASFAPARPDLGWVLAKFSGKQAVRPSRADVPAVKPPTLERVGSWAQRRFPSFLVSYRPEADLAIVGMSIGRFYGQKILNAALLLVGMPLLVLGFTIIVGLPVGIPSMVTMLLAVAGWKGPNGTVRSEARTRRREFNYALCTFVDLVAIERVAGLASSRKAMEEAAKLGDSWPFEQMYEVLNLSAVQHTSPWDDLTTLSHRIDVPALEEVASVMRLAGDEGSDVASNLAALGLSLRERLLAVEQAAAKSATLKMTLPIIGMTVTVVLIMCSPWFIEFATMQAP
ncbi:MAG: hypothetical protein LBR20_06595 [Propionibacteriaceae bacterium]|jgi:hypothetical protein|nr:hypothetical protein [Propionibacteriaceae bacterium]